jgi:hypothetical protein
MSVQEKNESIPQPSGRSRLWAFLNSSFGLFVLSSVVLSFMTWAYTEVSHSIEQRKVTTESITKLKTEMSYRIRLINDYFESECSEDSILTERGKKTFEDIRSIYRAEPTYQSIFPENKQKDLHILLWELAALLDGDEQKAFFVSFGSMLNFNAYLNRLNEQTAADGSFYGKPVDFKKEVAELKSKFSAATRPIANELPGVVTSTTLI